ncbi:hypothetical protein KBY97_10865 [Synechococcus sp. ATX 2A4]|uniref:hypothetical protein n=1 Tax=Synechococcus sp. ATX 2A4 TaxID=2823727 RepID=UPI0020CDEB5E|nr:hypothetical protein [Synechococcus sp. ATX 2A4]MCP9885620.1 hypothetical protein [Synechococcus sp. ATX 2A4]
MLETDGHQILAMCLFLRTMAVLMAVLMAVRVWLPPTFVEANPDVWMSARVRLVHDSL